MRLVALGAGESGVGAAVLAKKEGYDVFVSDAGTISEKYRTLLTQHDIPFEDGGHTESLVLNADEIVKSPGIPEDAPMVKAVREKGIPVVSEIEFAARYTDAKMICITGSNGKTTTTSWIFHIMKKAGTDVGLAGNIGRSLALQVAEDPHACYVIELSSFQLDDMFDFRADIAVLLNITPDHLDRYNFEMQNYVDSKMRITRNQRPSDSFIYWQNDDHVPEELHRHPIGGTPLPFSDAPEDGSKGFIQDGVMRLSAPAEFEMPVADISLIGRHNLRNAMAAAMACLAAGVGDTLRVSLTADPVEEVIAAKRILQAAGICRSGPDLISCPTCGRTKYDMIPIAREVERRLRGCDKPITVAVMGCVVNGPGEASGADVGIAGGIGEGLLFAKGKILRKVPQEQLVDALFEEIDKL